MDWTDWILLRGLVQLEHLAVLIKDFKFLLTDLQKPAPPPGNALAGEVSRVGAHSPIEPHQS